MAEAGDQPREPEVERTQAEDREDVRGEDEEGIGGDREDRRDRIDREDQVGGLDEHQGDRERGEDPLPPDAHGEVLLMELVGDREVATQPLGDHALHLRFLLGRTREEHLEPREDEEGAEDEEDPVIALDELRPDPDHQAAHRERAEDPPEEDAVLIDEGDLEMLEDQRDDEDVVHRETELDDVPREELDRREGAVVDLPVDGIDMVPEFEPVPVVGELDQDGEGARHHDRARREEGRLA